MMCLKEGIIVKLIGGLYTVKADDGKKYELKARGKFRHLGESPKVGDHVVFDDFYILNVKKRNNNLVRPPICNVDQAILINSAKQPDFSLQLLDRFLLQIELAGIRPVIVVTKIDLLTNEERARLEEMLSYYQKFYDILFISNKTGENVEQMKSILAHKISVFAGQSGAGKSSILNALDSSFQLNTGEISKALGRGRHTTRHVELYEICEGYVADTPGFSKLDLFNVTEEDIRDHFVDFATLSQQCRFRGCYHDHEPGCAVKRELEKGNIPQSRYRNYLQTLQELRQQKPRYPR